MAPTQNIASLWGEEQKLAQTPPPYSQLSSFLAGYNIDLSSQVSAEYDTEQRPFLTVITRTQGRRNPFLRDMLLSLAAQTCQDFELYIVLHKCDPAKGAEIRSMLKEYHEQFRDRITILICDHGGRSAPLNHALETVKGRYVSILDDDDFVFAHWVETFKELAGNGSSTVLRANCVKQDFEISTDGTIEVHAQPVTWFIKEWHPTYDPVWHLYGNQSPFMSVAIPATIFRVLKLRFDESLSTTEDWDFTTRAIMLCGVVNSPKVTCVYRWWRNAESSATLEKPETWTSNRQRIIDKFDARPILMASGAARRIVRLIEEALDLRGELDRVQKRADHLGEQAELLGGQVEHLGKQLALLREHSDAVSLRNQWMERSLVTANMALPWSAMDPELIAVAQRNLTDLISSTSWRITLPLRGAVRTITGNRSTEVTMGAMPHSLEECQRHIAAIRRSTSWRCTAPLRLLRKIVGRRSTKGAL